MAAWLADGSASLFSLTDTMSSPPIPAWRLAVMRLPLQIAADTVTQAPGQVGRPGGRAAKVCSIEIPLPKRDPAFSRDPRTPHGEGCLHPYPLGSRDSWRGPGWPVAEWHVGDVAIASPIGLGGAPRAVAASLQSGQRRSGLAVPLWLSSLTLGICLTTIDGLCQCSMVPGKAIQAANPDGQLGVV